MRIHLLTTEGDAIDLSIMRGVVVTVEVVLDGAAQPIRLRAFAEAARASFTHDGTELVIEGRAEVVP